MRILQICQRPQRRGAEVFASQLNAELSRQGHEVATAYLYPYSGDGRIPLRGSDVILGEDEDNALETLIGFRPALLGKVRRMLSSFRPDVIQVNGARSVKYGALARALNGRSGGVVVYRNIGSITDWVRGPRRKLFYRQVLRRMDGIAAISEESRSALEGVVPRDARLAVISNAVDPVNLEPREDRNALRRAHDTPLDAPVVIFVGSLSREKRVDRLMDAVAELRRQGIELYLWVVGAGPLRSELEEHAAAQGLDGSTRFFGAREDVGSFLAAADVLALVSETEGIPGVLLEAGYLGIPVVATRVGGVPECVVDGTTGFLVEPGDQALLVAALRRLVEDGEARARMGAAAREHVKERHLIESVTQQFVEFYSTLIRDASPPGAEAEAGRRAGGSRPFPSSPEAKLIVLLSRPTLEPSHEDRVGRLIAGGLDWEDVVRLARRHRVTPLVTTHLRGFRDGVPQEVQVALGRAHFTNAYRMLERTGQLFEVLDALEGAGITTVPYKGPALGAQLYGSGPLRMAGDLDLVVLPRYVPEARRVLESVGYRPRVPLDDAAVDFMVRHRYHEEFVRDDGGHVELHWRFTNREIPFALDLDRAWTRLESVDLNGRAVPTFHPEDLLLVLSVHGAKHRWDCLEWLAGFAELVRQSEAVDWDRLLHEASSLGVRRTLLLGVRLAADLFEVSVPPGVARRMEAEAQLPILGRYIKDLLASPPVGWELQHRIERDRFRVLLQERLRDRIRFVWHRAATPSDPKRWRVARIGAWSVPLHGIFRPFQAMARLVTLLWGPPTRI